MSKKNGLLTGMFYVLLANAINMCFNLVTNFILPKFLSVDSYAAIKTYQLYISYVGALHLGFIDGMYLKYGGRALGEIEPGSLSRNLGTLRVFQIGMAFVFIVISVALQNKVLLFFSLAVVPLNMANYFTSLYQATGEFNRYGRIINATAILNCLCNAVLIFLVRTDNYAFFLTAYVVVNVGIWMFLESGFHRQHKGSGDLFSFSFGELTENCGAGILLMLGNLSSFVLTGLDRWFVKFLMDNAAFAYYSFAVSMESFLNVAMNPVTVTLYNYFCRQTEPQQIRRVRNSVILFASVIIAAAFPAKFILEHFLTNYIPSAGVMFLLFATQLFSMLNKGIYVNLYKARKKQRTYFIKLVIVIVSGAVFNALCYWIYPVMESFAVGTLLSAILWFLLNKTDFKEVSYGFREYGYLILTLAAFLVCGFCFSAVTGLLIYGVYVLVSALVFLRADVIFLVNKLSMLVLKKKLLK